MIPKIIHYCWLSGDPIPDRLQKCMDSWEKKLPTYEFILWDLNRFDINQTLWVKQAFEAKKYAFAADYIRLYAVYNYGGIYLDMDVEVLKTFDSLLDSDYMLAYEAIDAIEAGVFGSAKHSQWLKACLHYYDNRKFILPDGTFDTKPLPKILWDVFKEKKIEMNILSPDFFTAKSYETGRIHQTSNTFTIHHFAGSWLSWDARLRQNIIRLIGMKQVLYLMRIKKVVQSFLCISKKHI